MACFISLDLLSYTFAVVGGRAVSSFLRVCQGRGRSNRCRWTKMEEHVLSKYCQEFHFESILKHRFRRIGKGGRAKNPVLDWVRLPFISPKKEIFELSEFKTTSDSDGKRKRRGEETVTKTGGPVWKKLEWQINRERERKIKQNRILQRHDESDGFWNSSCLTNCALKLSRGRFLHMRIPCLQIIQIDYPTSPFSILEL